MHSVRMHLLTAHHNRIIHLSIYSPTSPTWAQKGYLYVPVSLLVPNIIDIDKRELTRNACTRTHLAQSERDGATQQAAQHGEEDSPANPSAKVT